MVEVLDLAKWLIPRDLEYLYSGKTINDKTLRRKKLCRVVLQNAK